MHPNPAFRGTATQIALDFARSRGFGVLCANGAEGPIMAHVPFLLDADGQEADLHLVRSNPITRLPEGPVALVVSGPDSYVSPDWYGVDDQVPTWNYVAVHLRGRLVAHPQDRLRDVIDRQSAEFEKRLAPKAPWTSNKMTPNVLERMMRQILPFRIAIESIDSTFKLGQNKPDTVRRRAAEHMAIHGIGAEVQSLSALMADPPDRTE